MSSTIAVRVLATVAVVMLLHFAQAFFVPLLIAILIAYALAPLVSALTALLRYRVAAAALVVVALIGLGAVAVWAWSDDVERVWERVPAVAKGLTRSLQKYAQRPGSPVAEMKKAAAEMETIAQTEKAPPPAPAPAAQPSIPMWQVIWRGWTGLASAATQFISVLFLVFFMLASGDLFKKKLLAIAADRLAKRRDAVKMIDEIDQHVRSYLAILLVANVLVGVGVWAAFLMLGVEYAGLWGLAAGVFHTAPYFGPAVIAVTSLVLAYVQFGQWSVAIIAAGSTLVISALVGMVLATWLASRTTRMNTTASFVGLLFFGWMWDIWGLLLAIPILAIAKTICDRTEGWKPVGELLGR